MHIKPGKKTKAWNKARRILKEEFQHMGITRCEICGTGQMLSFAHRRKRRFITDEQELYTVVLLCIPCHQVEEAKPHQEMFDSLTKIIEQREVFA